MYDFRGSLVIYCPRCRQGILDIAVRATVPLHTINVPSHPYCPGSLAPMDSVPMRHGGTAPATVEDTRSADSRAYHERLERTGANG